jgi:hypothetical protein
MRLVSRRSLLSRLIVAGGGPNARTASFRDCRCHDRERRGTQGFIPTRGGWIPRPHRAAYVRQGPMSPTLPYHHVYDPSYAYDPAYAQLMSEHNWNSRCPTTLPGHDPAPGGGQAMEAA